MIWFDIIVIWTLDDLKLPNNNLSFITNNVKRIQSLNKRLKLIRYFRIKIGPFGLLFWLFFFFSYEKTNSCDVLTAYFRTEKLTIKKQQTDHEGCILILEFSINDSEYILINLYNANAEKEQT